MASWEQTDSRWIVSDLGEEGQNVGRYHWEEKDGMKWVKSTLKERFSNLPLFDPTTTENFIEVKATGLYNAKGEATVCNRKKKLFALYELDVTLTFSAKVKNPSDPEKPEKVVEGKILFPYLSNENAADDFSYRVQMDKNEDETYRLDIHKKSEAVIRATMSQFITELKAGANYAVNAKKTPETETKPTTTTTKPKETPSTPAPVQTSSTSAAAGFVNLNMTQKFSCRAEDLFDCFINAQKMSAYTQSKCVLENSTPATMAETLKGSKFTLLNGNIQGEFEEIIPNERLEQKWRMQDWEEGVFSKLVLNFSFQDGETTLKLSQTHIPAHDKFGNSVLEKTKQGWKNIFFNPIRIVFGFGGPILM